MLVTEQKLSAKRLDKEVDKSYICGMNKQLPHRLLAIILISLMGLMAGGCAETSGDEAGLTVAGVSAAQDGLDDGLIKEAAQCDSAPFVLSGKTGEAAVYATNSAANPAQSTAQKREHSAQRWSLADSIGGHTGSAVAMSRFGQSAFKHITHNRHSLLLRIRVLQI